MARSRKRLPPPWVDAQDLRLRGFPNDDNNWYNGLQCILYNRSEVQAVFDGFMERLLSATGKRYFPVYRMADGEFLFCLGWRAPLWQKPRDIIDHSIEALRQKWWFAKGGFGTMWGEHYSVVETIQGRRKLAGLIREIVEHGALGLYFMRRGDHWGEQNIVPMLKWLESHKVKLTVDSYIPFYMVYAALSGPHQQELLAGQRILVATNTAAPRPQGIAEGLKRIGAKSVEFLDVSASKSLYCQVDVAKLAEAPDLALVGAGVGSANILVQLKQLAVPAIDAGIFLESLIDPSRCDPRPFMIPR